MYRRRLKIFLGIMLALMLVELGRLVQLQILRGAEYRRRAERRLLGAGRPLPTVRGRILDRRGRVLAMDRPCFELCFRYEFLAGDRHWQRRQVRALAESAGADARRARALFRRRVQRTWRLAEEITGVSREEMGRRARRIVEKVAAIRRLVGGPVREEHWAHPIVTGLDEPTAVALRERLPEMVGASVRPSHRRYYPYGDAACHLIGRLGPVSRERLERTARDQEPTAGYLVGDLVGVSGVEKACEDLPGPGGGAGLRGRRGYRRVSYGGRVVEEVPARLGRDVHLTIDIELQRALARLLGDSGLVAHDHPRAVVVLDVPTGEVLAAVSIPTYDLNEFARQFQRLVADRADLPLLDRTVRGRYPPGSTVKPLVALAGLSEGRITETTTFLCRGYLHSPEAFTCWIWRYHVGHGRLNVVQAIQHSCNVFFYHLGEDLGVARLRAWFERFGFAEPPGTQLPGESAGRLPDPRNVVGVGTARNLGIGQGPIAVTPMHVANAMAAIARGGEFRTPVLIRELASRQRRWKLPVSAGALALVQKGMYLVVNSSQGTAKAARHPLVEVCGKTGTAQTAPRRVGGRVVRSGDTAWFAGFAPYRNPRIAFVVMVEYVSEGGGKVCAPIARQVVETCLRMGYLDAPAQATAAAAGGG